MKLRITIDFIFACTEKIMSLNSGCIFSFSFSKKWSYL